MRIARWTWGMGVAAALVLGATGGNAADQRAAAPVAPPAEEGCLKQVFQKLAVEGSWLVRECEAGDPQRYRIAFRAPKAQGEARIALRDVEAIVDVQYRLLAPETLLIDAQAERGGRAYLVHPVAGRASLSVLEFDYLSGDEESLVVRQDGRRIRASTRSGTRDFVIDAQGVLSRLTPAGTRKRP